MDGEYIVHGDVAHVHVGDAPSGYLHVCDCDGDSDLAALYFLVASLLGLELPPLVSSLGECPKLAPIFYHITHSCPDVGGVVVASHA